MNKKKIISILLPLVIIAAGFGTMKFLIAHRQEPKKEERRNPGILVKTMTVSRGDYRITVSGTGTVEPDREISIIPQVSGSVIYVSPGLKVGGFFREGDVMLRIDDSDYRLALEQAEAVRAKAEFELATIRSKAKVARREWERISAGRAEPPNPLVTYEPQLKSAEAALASAEAAVKKARLDLERTVIRAPFNCRVRSENVDTGQYVRAGNPIARVAGTDAAEILVPLSIDELKWIRVPGIAGAREGAKAVVRLESDGDVYEWEGRITRSTGEIDPKTRMMDIIVKVNDPYGISGNSSAKRPPLATGTFVNVSFKGEKLEGVFALPLRALRDDSTVWVMDDSHKLRMRKVEIVRLEKDTVVISKGLDPGEKVILSNISGAADGMKLREEMPKSRDSGETR